MKGNEMNIDIREVKGKKDLRTFIYLPEKLHADHPKWVHPIYVDDWNYFDPAKNKAFGYCDTLLLLAWRGTGMRRPGHGDHQPPIQRAPEREDRPLRLPGDAGGPGDRPRAPRPDRGLGPEPRG